MYVPAVLLLSALAKTASAAVAPTFTDPAPAPTATSSFYIGASNGTIQNSPVVAGKVFDRFIQIWLENTDYSQAATVEIFQNFSTQGITLTGYYGLTHTSEPNYMAAAGGSFFGLSDDNFESVPANVSTIVDLLEAKNISWSEYQENMPMDGYPGFNYTNPSPDVYTYYVRKHNPLVLFDSVANDSTRAARLRNFNDFAVDLGNNSLSQWIFITPNLRNDGHDTNVAFAGDWLEYWLVPLLADPNFNTDRTLILLTFDENETYDINNQVYTILLGGVIPENLKGTNDSTFYTHYSTLSTVQANWELGNLGRGDTNQTLNNVFQFVAEAVGYQNNGLNASSPDLPQLNAYGTYPGPFNPDMWTTFLAPNISAIGAGGGPTYISPGTDTNLTSATPVNLTSQGTTSGAVSAFGVGSAHVLMTVAGAVFAGGALLL